MIGKNNWLLRLHYKNVYCKISGMATEAAWQQWKKDDFTRYLGAVVELFGIAGQVME